jgi:TonB-linked SusC/RagA family outer membrane protein
MQTLKFLCKKNIAAILLIVSLFLSVATNAQEGKVSLSGTITSAEDGTALPGVNVLVKGTTTGTITNIDGKYQIDVASGDVVVYSYIGYISEEITAGSQSIVDLALTPDIASLSEVVVIGYGTQKKSHNTGSIAQIDGGNVASIQAARVDEALAGKLSGVMIQNQDGSPGAAPKIQIRAASSITSDSEPLIVVDGFPISGNLASVNPNDIASLEILKDAASAAIYGSKGANGVVLVTTKKGKTGKARVSYNTYLSTSKKYRENILSTASEHASKARSEIAAGNWDVSEQDADLIEFRLTAFEESPDVESREDWLFQNGTTQSHDLSISGGTDDVNYFASIGYLNTDGIVITTGYEKINARLNVDANLGKKLKAGLSFNGYTSNRDILGHNMRDLLRSYAISPMYHTEASIAFVQELDAKAQALGLGLATFDEGWQKSTYEASSIYDLEPGMGVNDWHYGRAGNGIGGSGDAGSAIKLDNSEDWEKTYFANVSTYLQFEIIDGLNLKTALGADILDTREYTHQLLGFDSKGRAAQTDMGQTDLKSASVLSTTTLGYSKVFGNHDISAVVGYEYQTNTYNGIDIQGTNVPDEVVQNFALFDPADLTVTERDELVVRNSVFGRINYAYANRYLASASIRRDGDSRFGANERYATFPAFSLGWNVHNESFLEGVEPLSRLKVRFSRGSLGTSSFLGSYDALSLLVPQATTFGTGYLIPENSANPDLTWQTNTETNYGIDFGFIRNRFLVSVDYYTSDIEDILIDQAQSEIYGNPSAILNVGDVQSSGIELELKAAVIQKQDFSFDVTANLSTVKTEITDLGGLDELSQVIYGTSGRGPYFRNYVGGEIGEMWALETKGDVEMIYVQDPTKTIGLTSGASYIVDQQSEGEAGYGEIDATRSVEDGGDLVKVGSNNPDFYWGLALNFTYKAFDMSMQFQGSQGAEIYNLDPHYYNSEFGDKLRSSFDANVWDADNSVWIGDGIADHNGEFYEDNRYQTDAYIQDASYIALRNLTIGYTLKEELISKIGLGSVRAYVAASNLLYIMADDYTSYNPEGVYVDDADYQGPTTYGVQLGSLPIARSFTVGLSVNF